MDALTLRFRLFGIGLHITLTFWLVSGILGYLVIESLVRMNPLLKEHWLGLFAVWMGCCLVGFLTHEIGSGVTARVFGVRPTMVLGFGSMTVADLNALSLWKRVLVHLAGPLVGLGVYALVVWAESYVHTLPIRFLNRWVLQPIFFLKMLTFWYNLISLLPLLPMNGGKVIMEVLWSISPSRGMSWAYGWSFLCCLSFVVHAVQHWNDAVMPMPFGLDAEPRFTAFLFGYFAITNLLAYFKTRPPRSLRRDDEEEQPKTQDAAWA